MTKIKRWSPQEEAWLRELYPDHSNREIADLLGRTLVAIKNRARTLGLKKSAEYLSQEMPGKFRKGQAPWNQGISYQAGGRAKDHQYRPGTMPHNWAPVGTETDDGYGYLKRKVRDDAPVGMSRKNWEFVHALKWEEFHGRPVPEGHLVRMKDGGKRNFSRENLALVSRAENAILNKFFAMKNPPEGGFDVLLNLARIKLAAGRRKKES